MNMHQPVETSFRNRVSGAWAPISADRGRRRLLIVVVAVAMLAIVGWLALGGSGDEAAAPAAGEAGSDTNLPSVSVIVPRARQVADSVGVTGSIAARRDMPVGVQGEGGAVTAVHVEAGDIVRAGQVLATIDKSVQAQQVQQLQASLAQARADAALAQAELDRALTLVDRGFISKADIDRRTASRDSANARVNVAAAQLREGQARLARLDIRAPKAGLVLERNVERGQVVSAGSAAVFRMAEDGAMEMRAAVAEQDLVGLEVGQSATVRTRHRPAEPPRSRAHRAVGRREPASRRVRVGAHRSWQGVAAGTARVGRARRCQEQLCLCRWQRRHGEPS
jgi:RND family efflux transporter MFP subunit